MKPNATMYISQDGECFATGLTGGGGKWAHCDAKVVDNKWFMTGYSVDPTVYSSNSIVRAINSSIAIANVTITEWHDTVPVLDIII